MQANKLRFYIINGFAMQYGMVLGIISILGMSAFIASMSQPWLAPLAMLLLFVHPVLIVMFLLRFRNGVSGQGGEFSFVSGFLETFLMCLYSTAWLSLAVYVYFAFIDNGFFFDSYQAELTRPDVVTSMKASGVYEQIGMATGGKGPEALVDMMRQISPASYSAMVLSMNFFVSIIFAAVAGIAFKRRGQ